MKRVALDAVTPLEVGEPSIRELHPTRHFQFRPFRKCHILIAQERIRDRQISVVLTMKPYLQGVVKQGASTRTITLSTLRVGIPKLSSDLLLTSQQVSYSRLARRLDSNVLPAPILVHMLC
jgi:hypothetical protein